MRSAASLEVMNSINPELHWKAVTKGKRSKKSVARSFNGAPKVGSISPKRVGDFSGSDSDKLSVPVIGQPTSGKSEYVPIKKRRHVIRPPLPQPHIPSFHCQDSHFPQSNSNGTLSKQAEEDFSGIELLAAAASMEVCADNANKKDHVAEECSIPGSSDASAVITLSKRDLKCNDSGNSSCTTTLCCDSTSCLLVLNKCAPTSQTPSGSMTVVSTSKCISSKVYRRNWDLNIEMDAWEEPYEDSIAGNISKDATDFHMHLEGSKEGLEDHELSNPGNIGVEFSTLKNEVKLGVTPDRTSSTKSPRHEKHLLKPATNSHFSAIDKDVDENNPNQVASGDADLETPSRVMSSDANLDISFGKLHCSSSILVAEEKNNIIMQTMTQEVGMPGAEERKNLSHVTCKKEYGDNSNCNSDELIAKSGTFLASGAFAEDEKPVVVTDSKVWNNEICVANSKVAEKHSQFERNELFAKLEDVELTNVELEKIMSEDSCNSYSARAQYDNCSTPVEKLDSPIDPHPDSPYEDGELRGSFLYSWKDNELETECVDYESDGRKEGGWDAADNLGSDIVEGSCEGSRGTEGRSSMMKKSPEGNGINSDLVKHPLRRNFIKDDESCGKKESNGCSGTTVEPCMEMVIDENKSTTKRRVLTNRTGIDDCMSLMDEYVTKMARGKLQSRTEGRVSFEVANGKDIFLRQCRSRRVGGFRESDVSPEKYAGRYRPATHGSERDGVDQWTKWGFRGCYTSTHRGTDCRNGTSPRRSITGDSVDKFGGLNFHDQRQTADYMSRDFQRPFFRTRSPVDRVSNINMLQRMPPTRRFNSYKGRGHYPQTACRDFGDDFEPMPNGTSAPVRFSRISKRERSLSPNPRRDAHMPLTRRRSHSRSRTRSPRAWNSYRDGTFDTRRNVRSPNFTSDARIERMKVPFHKPSSASEYREGYTPPPSGRFSPQHNSHWVGDRNFSDNRFKRRRSPTGVFRCNNRSFNSVNYSGRPMSDEYPRPMNRRRRFFLGDNDGTQSKFETNCDDRKLGNRGQMHQGKQCDVGRSFKRFQYDVINNFETSNFNDKVSASDAISRDVPQVQGYKEEQKKEFEI